MQIIKVGQTFTCDSQILQQYLNDTVILRTDGNSFPDQITIIPETRPPTMDDFEFNSSDSFSSTESIIPKNIQCPKCPKRFMFKSDLTRHHKHKHAVKQKLSCGVCQKEFFSQQNLKFHEKSHRQTQDIVCFLCKKTFRSQSVCYKHMEEKHKMVQRKNKAECEVCGKWCVCYSADINAKPICLEGHGCDICGKIFRKLSSYKTHVLKHEKSIETKTEEFYKCHSCPMSFNEKTSFGKNLLTVFGQ